MATSSTAIINRLCALVLLVFCIPAIAQEVETVELTTSTVHPIHARIGNASLIQLPVEAIATNVGDPGTWMVEKLGKIVSVKQKSEAARDTTLAVVTREGTLNFAVHVAGVNEAFTQTIRITKVYDDSKPLQAATTNTSSETLSDVIIREIRIAQNYYALKQVNSKELQNLDQSTQMREIGNDVLSCYLLQTFRFRDTRHIILHFVTQNKVSQTLSFDQRRTTVSVADTLFAPVAVSLGRSSLEPSASAENFIVLNGDNGLSPFQKFNIFVPTYYSTAQSK